MTLWLLPLMPLIGAMLVAAAGFLPSRSRGATRAILIGSVGVASLATTLIVACAMAVGGVSGALGNVSAAWPWWGPVFTPRLTFDALSRMMAILVPAIALPVVLYAAASMREYPALARLVALLVAFTGAMQLLVLAGDMLTLIVGWELVGACSWALIAFEWHDAWRVRDARTAFLTTRGGDLGLYVAAAALFSTTGSLAFDAVGTLHGASLSVVAAGILLAAAAKSAQLPFSPWLFAAMAGPTPASALLHSATMVAAGAYLLARLQPMLGAASWLGPAIIVVGMATSLVGGVVGALHSDLKKVLAASTSAQYGLMFVAVGAGFTGAASVHLVAHAAFKALLFLCAGAVLHVAGTLDLRSLRACSLGRAFPLLATLFAVGTLALAAVPPLGGAYSKEQVLAAATERSAWLGAWVIAAGFLSAFYAARLQLLAFGMPERWSENTPGRDVPERDRSAPRRRAVPTTELVGIFVLAAISLVLGLFWLPDSTPLVESIVGGRLATGADWELPASLASVAVAVAACWWLFSRCALLNLGLPERVREYAADWLGLPTAARRLVVDPVLALANTLAALDDRVIDAGIRGAARVAALLSRTLAWWGERGVDGVVALLARGAEVIASLSRRVDDDSIDAAVEGVARDIGAAGAQSRRLQTGLAHQYYLILAVGVLAVVAVASASVVLAP